MKQVQVKGIELRRYSNDGVEEVPDLVAIEEPLEIRLGHGSMDGRKEEVFSVTMRTPGADVELALGLLFSLPNIQFYLLMVYMNTRRF